MDKRTQLQQKLKEQIGFLESVTSIGAPNNTLLSDTYSELPHDDLQNLLNGLKELLDNPQSIEANQDIIPIHLVMIDPQMREIQMLINEIVE